ncbi:hypothetical protein CZ774_10315 [Frigoribacterium sp. JB110]|nr:hypothetical protein CZ774_10315 [Frigoribacterium sp. JB110]
MHWRTSWRKLIELDGYGFGRLFAPQMQRRFVLSREQASSATTQRTKSGTARIGGGR